jgi:ubiquitin carboxyl-terminal hydrolase 25
VTEKARKAVKIIADNRGSKPLLGWLETGSMEEQQMDVGEAYRLFQIDDRTLDDEMVLSVYNIVVSDNPSAAEQYNKAISTIATDRGSSMIMQAIRGERYSNTQASAEEPVGLENIGNTCYLNSLLQFFFTLPELRNLVLNFKDVKMDLGDPDIAKKRVGSRRITLPEIERAQKCKFAFLLASNSPANIVSRLEPQKPFSRNDLLSTHLCNAATRSCQIDTHDNHSRGENSTKVNSRKCWSSWSGSHQWPADLWTRRSTCNRSEQCSCWRGCTVPDHAGGADFSGGQI